MQLARNCAAVFRRELKSYFESPVAYVFLVTYLVLQGFLTFFVSRFFEIEQADLRPFFSWQPWVCLILVPAVSMRLWAEERRSGTIELLFTLPVTLTEVLLGKFLAAWLFLGLALALTFPIVLTSSILLQGNLDGGVVAGGYIGSLLLAGAYLSVGMATSAMTRNQVISFVMSVAICFALVLAGFPPFTDLFPEKWEWIVKCVSAFSVMTHFDALGRGVLDLRDVVFFISVIAVMLFGARLVLRNRQ